MSGRLEADEFRARTGPSPWHAGAHRRAAVQPRHARRADDRRRCAAIWPSSSAIRAWSRFRAFVWRPILHGVILRSRGRAKSAAKYASIWTPDGSPLRVWTEKQAKLLAGYLGERGHSVLVRHAMRYGNPSIAARARRAEGRGSQSRILVLPLYPQYAAATTASVFDAVSAWAARTRDAARAAFRQSATTTTRATSTPSRERVYDHWMRDGRADKLVLSFHGVPERTLQARRPVSLRVPEDGAAARASGSICRAEQLLVTFQSRFGNAKWLEPYTEPTLRKLARRRCAARRRHVPRLQRRIASRRSKRSRRKRATLSCDAGGKEFHYIAALNDQHEWIAALAAIAIRHLQGWPTDGRATRAALEQQRRRALAMGASAIVHRAVTRRGCTATPRCACPCCGRGSGGRRSRRRSRACARTGRS